MAAPGPPPEGSPPQGTLARSPPAQEAGPELNTTETIYHGAIEAGDDSHDSDSFETESAVSSTTSISSSIRGHVYENGRRYHKYGRGTYTIPNDDAEQDREDMKHAAILRLCEGKLIFAPIGDHPQNIIDLGTGTGIWAIEVGDLYPSAVVTGLDLSPIQPDWVPANVKFLVDDVEDEFAYPPDHFDLIHMRHLINHIRNIPQLMNRCYTHLKPGAWIEIQEHEVATYSDDNTMPEDYAPSQCFDFVRQGMAKFGLDCSNILTVDDKLRDAGFINISRTVYKLPVGPWPKDQEMKMIGLFWRTVIYDGIQGICAKSIGQGLGWPKDKLEVFLVSVRKGLMDRTVHAYSPLHIVIAQKPM